MNLPVASNRFEIIARVMFAGEREGLGSRLPIYWYEKIWLSEFCQAEVDFTYLTVQTHDITRKVTGRLDG